MGNRLDLYVSAMEKRVIEECKDFWKKNKCEVISTTDRIFVAHTLPMHFEMILLENIIAKGVQEKCKLPVIGIQVGENKRSCSSLDEAFQFDTYNFLWEEDENSDRLAQIEARAEEITDECYGNKDKVIQINYKGIFCGDAIYDTLLRKTDGRDYEWNAISREECLQTIKQTLRYVDYAIDFFEKYKPAYIIALEYVGVRGLIISVAQHYGATYIGAYKEYSSYMYKITPDKIMLKDVRTTDIIGALAEKYMDYDNYDSTKSNFILDKYNEKYDLQLPSNGKKNIFILLNSMIDMPRCSYDMRLFHDFTEWYEYTLQVVSKIDNVNWIIKDHPMTAFYGQKEYTKRMFDKYKSSNMYWCDSNMSGEVVKSMAAGAVVCCSTAGLELWALGVPTVTTADSFFTKQGISYNMKSIQEYSEMLENITEIKLPGDESMNLAKKLVRAWQRIKMPDDKLSQIFEDYIKKEYLEAQRGQSLWNEVKYEFEKKFVRYMQENDIRDSSCYKLDKICEV